MSSEGHCTSVSLPHGRPVRALPSSGFSKGVLFRISLFNLVRGGGVEGGEKERPKKNFPHCQSNAKLCLSGMSRADAAMRCQSGSPSSAPWVPINCSGARFQPPLLLAGGTQAEVYVRSLSPSAPGGGHSPLLLLSSSSAPALQPRPR